MKMTAPEGYVDINYGVDFERAKERLSAQAGEVFRRLHRARSSGTATEEEIQALRQEYAVACNREKGLRVDDTASILQILGTTQQGASR